MAIERELKLSLRRGTEIPQRYFGKRAAECMDGTFALASRGRCSDGKLRLPFKKSSDKIY